MYLRCIETACQTQVAQVGELLRNGDKQGRRLQPLFSHDELLQWHVFQKCNMGVGEAGVVHSQLLELFQVLQERYRNRVVCMVVGRHVQRLQWHIANSVNVTCAD